jgi:putative flippase GtrA
VADGGDSRWRLPEGIAREGVRFALAGCVVAAVYISTTTFFAAVLGMPFEAALVIGFATALVVHYTLQRAFVWVHREEFALPFRHQASRYLLVAGMQYVFTAASVALLPAALGLPTEIIYVATVMLTGSINFLVFRNRIFHAAPTAAPTVPPSVAKAT